MPEGQRTKWPKEEKPKLEALMHDLAVLRRGAEMLNEPIYVFGDDAKDYFNQLAMASCDHHKLGIVFLAKSGAVLECESDAAPPLPDTDRLAFVSELRLGFGTHGASNVAQRFSEALLSIFRRRMDAGEESHMRRGLSPQLDSWLEARAAVAATVAADELAGKPLLPIVKVKPSAKNPTLSRRHFGVPDDAHARALLEHSRLYACFIYTDDPVWASVGVDRTLRALRVWRLITQETGLIMAIPEKWHLGTHCLWLGIIVVASLGVVLVPRQKLLRASQALHLVLKGGQPFHVYRALCGLLEHLRAVNLRGAHVMHGLYAPHQPNGASRFGPSGKVFCDELMTKQLRRWQRLLRQSSGVSVRSAFVRSKVEPISGPKIMFCADACFGDEDPSGLGGYCHGFYWHFLVPASDYDVVSTPILEFLAAAFDVIIFQSFVADLCDQEGSVVLRTDALTTALTIPAESQKSPMLVDAYQGLIQTSEWAALLPVLQIAHLFGDANAFSDRISRSKWSEFARLTQAVGVRPVQLPVPTAATNLYARVVAMERIRRTRVHHKVLPRGGMDNRGSDCHRSQCELRCNCRVDVGLADRSLPPAKRARRLGLGLASEGSSELSADDKSAHEVKRWLDELLEAVERNCQVTSHRPLFTCGGDQSRRRAAPPYPPIQWHLRRAARATDSAPSGKAAQALTAAISATDSAPSGKAAQALTAAPSATDSAPSGKATRLFRCGSHAPAAAGPAGRPSSLFMQRIMGCGASTPTPASTSAPAPPPATTAPLPSSFMARLIGSSAQVVGTLPSVATAAVPAGPLLQRLGIRRETARPSPYPLISPPRPVSQTIPSLSDQVVASIPMPPRPPPRRAEPSKLSLASATYARARATALAAGPDPDMQVKSNLADLLALGETVNEMSEFGTNINTLKKDDRAWEFWEVVCAKLDTSPLRTPEEVREHPERQAFLLAVLLMYASAVCKPKTPGRQCIKPRSALAYPLAIIRIFGRWGIVMPGFKSLKVALHGLMRQYILYHGTHSLQPQRAEPMRFTTVTRINQLARDGRHKIHGIVWDDAVHIVFMFHRLVLFMIVTAFRLGEIVYHASGEIMYITRDDIFWIILGIIYREPSPQLLLSMRSGRDKMGATPPRAKPDQWGEIHCPFPVYITFYDEPDNAAKAIRDIELRLPCRGEARKVTPLFADEAGNPYTHARLDGLLNAVLTVLFGAAVASLYSFHSFRSGLATALFAAGVPDATIMLMCRWMCPESLHIYRRLTVDQYDKNLRGASRADVSGIQSANVPRTSGDRGFAELGAEFASSALERQVLRDVTAAQQGGGPSAGRRDAGSVGGTGTASAAPTLSDGVGCRVLVPKALWPTYSCTENNGAGWEGTILKFTGTTAVVQFSFAKTANGEPYENERLPLRSLRRL